MAKFCPECPNRGNCIEELEGLRIVSSRTEGEIRQHADGRSTATFSMENGIPIGPTALQVIYNDVNDGRSEPIQHTGPTYESAVKSAYEFGVSVEACEGPTTSRRFLGLLKTIHCGAQS